jgi:hypothetical protein
MCPNVLDWIEVTSLLEGSSLTGINTGGAVSSTTISNPPGILKWVFQDLVRYVEFTYFPFSNSKNTPGSSFPHPNAPQNI